MKRIDLRCPCGQRFVFDATLTGSLVLCPECGRMTRLKSPREDGRRTGRRVGGRYTDPARQCVQGFSAGQTGR